MNIKKSLVLSLLLVAVSDIKPEVSDNKIEAAIFVADKAIFAGVLGLGWWTASRWKELNSIRDGLNKVKESLKGSQPQSVVSRGSRAVSRAVPGVIKGLICVAFIAHTYKDVKRILDEKDANHNKLPEWRKSLKA